MCRSHEMIHARRRRSRGIVAHNAVSDSRQRVRLGAFCASHARRSWASTERYTSTPGMRVISSTITASPSGGGGAPCPNSGHRLDLARDFAAPECPLYARDPLQQVPPPFPASPYTAACSHAPRALHPSERNVISRRDRLATAPAPLRLHDRKEHVMPHAESLPTRRAQRHEPCLPRVRRQRHRRRRRRRRALRTRPQGRRRQAPRRARHRPRCYLVVYPLPRRRRRGRGLDDRRVHKRGREPMPAATRVRGTGAQLGCRERDRLFVHAVGVAGRPYEREHHAPPPPSHASASSRSARQVSISRSSSSHEKRNTRHPSAAARFCFA